MDFSYVAGFFDGEGCVSTFQLKGQQPKIKLTMSQKRVKVLEEIRDFLECGNITHRANGSHVLHIYGRDDIRMVIRGIYPYAIVKKQELKLGYELAGLHRQSGYYGQGVSLKDHERRVWLMNEIRRLKRV